jgi:hypothetical protein
VEQLLDIGIHGINVVKTVMDLKKEAPKNNQMKALLNQYDVIVIDERIPL